MPLDTATTTVIAAAVGGGVASIVAGGFAIWNLWLTRRSEERRQIRELAVSVAIENFKIYKEASERLGGGMQPLDVYLMHAMHLVAGLDGSLKTPEQIREHLRSTYAASNAANIEIDEHNKKIQEARRKGVVSLDSLASTTLLCQTPSPSLLRCTDLPRNSSTVSRAGRTPPRRKKFFVW